MKKIIGILGLIVTLGLVSSVSAQTGNFSVSLGYGSTNKAEVVELQKFLVANGYLKVAPTGAYLGQTAKAVADFQKAKGITPASGYFGPLTRAAANATVATGMTPSATVSVVTVTSANSGIATAILANERSVSWQTNNYPQGVGVNVNLLRKSASTPESFSLIRTVAKDTANDGSQTFVLQNNELGGDVYVEVKCSSTCQFKSGCHFGGSVMKAN